MHSVKVINNKILMCENYPIVYISGKFYTHKCITEVSMCNTSHNMKYCNLDGKDLIYCDSCFLIFNVDTKTYHHYQINLNKLNNNMSPQHKLSNNDKIKNNMDVTDITHNTNDTKNNMEIPLVPIIPIKDNMKKSLVEMISIESSYSNNKDNNKKDTNDTNDDSDDSDEDSNENDDNDSIIIINEGDFNVDEINKWKRILSEYNNDNNNDIPKI